NNSLIEGSDGALSIVAAGAIAVTANSEFVATDGNGIAITQNGDADTALTLTAGATVDSSGDGIVVVQLGEGDATVTTAAEITVDGNGVGIASLTGGSATIINTGTVEAGGNAGLFAAVGNNA